MSVVARLRAIPSTWAAPLSRKLRITTKPLPAMAAQAFVVCSRDYIKKTAWQQAWMMSARLDYSPVVDVRRAKAPSSSGGATIAQSRTAALEASKYATKATDLINMGSALGEYHRQVKGLRLSASSTSLKPYIADSPIDDKELTDSGESPLGETLKGTAVWFDDIGEYLFSDIH